MSEPIISVKDVVKIYKSRNIKFRALNGVSLDIYPGEFVAIVGTSGSGKSTLLNLMAGLEKPSAGRIFVKQRPIHKMTEDELVDFRLKNIGFIFQQFNLMDMLTALENAAFPLMLRGTPQKKRIKIAQKVLDSMGLAEHAHHTPSELSGGQQQRVSIARAIITKPPILFADEPTGNLDSATAAQITDILRVIVNVEGATLVLVTHDIEKTKYADRIVHLADGRITHIEDITHKENDDQENTDQEMEI
jgi:putative ABC transport system ATP-binding protein